MCLCATARSAQAQFTRDLAPKFFDAVTLVDSIKTDSARADSTTQASDGQDSIAAVPKRKVKLLPENIYPLTNVFWGESGLFRGLGWAPLTPDARRSELDFRRSLLSTHQIGGFVTWAGLVTTLVMGQIVLNSYNNLDFESALRLRPTHQTIATATFVSYMLTGLMSILAPPPLIQRSEWNTVSTHRVLSYFHFVGMLVTPYLAIRASGSRDINEIRSLRQAHQIAGYATAAILSAALIVVTF
jgi:hypothetical protein